MSEAVPREMRLRVTRRHMLSPQAHGSLMYDSQRTDLPKRKGVRKIQSLQARFDEPTVVGSRGRHLLYEDFGPGWLCC